MQTLKRILLMPDANTGADSSTAPDDKEQDSSPVEQAEEQAVKESSEDTETESEETATEEQVEQTTEEQTETQEEKVEEEVKPTAEKTIDKPEDEKLPFNTHPRFKELVQEKNQYKQEVEAVKPLAEQAKVTNAFLQENQISAQDYQSALQYLMLLRRDPVQAFKMLQPTYEQLALLAGERLPADLQTEVAAGTIAPERAQELAKMRATQQHQQWRAQQAQGQQQSGQVEAVQGTIASWAQTKQTVDPDFKPGTDLWTLTDKYIAALPPFRSAQEAMQGSEKAYTDAKAFFAKYAPKTVTPVKRPLQSRQMATGNNTVVKTPEDVMRAINAGKKPHQLRYS